MFNYLMKDFSLQCFVFEAVHSHDLLEIRRKNELRLQENNEKKRADKARKAKENQQKALLARTEKAKAYHERQEFLHQEANAKAKRVKQVGAC